MVCNLCKENPAVLYLEQPGGGKTRRLCLCEKCAVSRGIIAKPQIPNQEKINELIAELDQNDKTNREDQKRVCPLCKRSLYDIKRTKLVGCQSCYDKFPDEIEEISGVTIQNDGDKQKARIRKKKPKQINIANIDLPTYDVTHRSSVLREKLEREREFGPEDELGVLKNELEKAVRLENYEEAAKLRDEIERYKKNALPMSGNNKKDKEGEGEEEENSKKDGEKEGDALMPPF